MRCAMNKPVEFCSVRSIIRRFEGTILKVYSQMIVSFIKSDFSIKHTQNVQFNLFCGKAVVLNIQKTKIMASSPTTSWEIDGETVETVSDFIFWTLKSLQMGTAAMKLKGTYSLEGKL